jgi:Mg-chelatase subunit ChlD
MPDTRALAAAVLLLAAAAPARPNPVSDFRLAQAVQGRQPSTVVAYLDVWDAESKPVSELAADSVSGTLGEHSLSPRRVVPFRDAGEGVAYIFAVDISRSLSPAAFAKIRSALSRWIDELGPLDRAAALTFGDQSRLVVDFTADRAALRAAVEALAPTDMTTVLYRGLEDALELSSRRDTELPARRVLLVLSDGKDEGSGLAIDDVMVSLREHGLPIYAIGFGGPARRESLDILLRFATTSGGRFVEVGAGDFEAAYAAMREAIDRVWVAELDCPGCEADGSARRLQVNLRLVDRVLSKGTDLRLLPPVESATAATAAGAPAAAVIRPRGEAEEASVEGERSGGTAFPTWLLLTLLGGVVVVVGALAVRRARSRAASPAAASLVAETAGAPAPPRPKRRELTGRERAQLDVPLDSEPLVPPIAVCLTVVRGAVEGAEHRFLLHRRGVVGSGGNSDIVLPEPALAAEQLELIQERGGVYVRNLSRSPPTLLNGAPLVEGKALGNGDLVGNRGFIARVRLG